MGNPVLYPLFYETKSQDVVILHINLIERSGPPKTSVEIANRLDEIEFNSNLMKELRAVHFVQKLMDEGWIKDEFLTMLRDRSRACATQWLEDNYEHIGVRSSVDLKKEFL